jgi:CCR4-NOT transcription complex subunit 1
MDAVVQGDTSVMLPNNGRSPMNNHLLPSLEGEMDDGQIALPNLAPYVTFNPQVILYSTQPGAKQLVLQAINMSIREVGTKESLVGYKADVLFRCYIDH